MTQVIIDALAWLGITPDEGPFFQSDSFDYYKSFMPLLEKSDQVYKCFCTREEIAERREKSLQQNQEWKYDRHCLHLSSGEIEAKLRQGAPYALRMKVPEGSTGFNDLIHGEIRKENSEIEDFVLFRSDFSPVYNFAVVADDLRMQITHVIRGDDHISNTFKQIMIYRLLEGAVPFFAHLPLILDEKKAKLSKRSGTVSVLEFRDQGILPEAFLNFIALIGWNPGGDREIMSMEEMCSAFTLERVTKKGGVFDRKKLEWMNARYIASSSPESLLEKSRGFFLKKNIDITEFSTDFTAAVLALFRERARYLTDFPLQTACFFSEPDLRALPDFSKIINPQSKPLLEALYILLEKSDFSCAAIENCFRECLEKTRVKIKDLMQPARFAVSGSTSGPSLYHLMELLGREKTLARLWLCVR